jgi:hypothetical protein
MEDGGRKWKEKFQNGCRRLHLMSRSRDSVITEETVGEKVMIPARKRVESLQGNGPKGSKPTGKKISIFHPPSGILNQVKNISNLFQCSTQLLHLHITQ